MSTHDNLPALPHPHYTMPDLEIMAKHVAASRMFGMDQAQAFTLMLLCHAKGLHPIQAVERYHIIQGRPAMKSDAMLAEFQAKGGTVVWHVTTNDKCEALFTHPTHAPKGNLSTFSMADAKLAELTKNPTWTKYPANMLRARVISNGVRMTLPGIVVGIYTPEEVEDFDPAAPPVQVEATERIVPVAREEIEPAPAKEERKDARPFYRLVADGCEKTCDEFRFDFPDALDILNGYQVSRHVLKVAIARGAIEDPGVIKDGKVQALLNSLYADATNYAWMRRELASYLKAKLAEAQEQAALQDTPDGDHDVDDPEAAAVVAEAREPGSDG